MANPIIIALTIAGTLTTGTVATVAVVNPNIISDTTEAISEQFSVEEDDAIDKVLDGVSTDSTVESEEENLESDTEEELESDSEGESEESDNDESESASENESEDEGDSYSESEDSEDEDENEDSEEQEDD